MRVLLPASLLCAALTVSGCALGPAALGAVSIISAAGTLLNGLGKDAEVGGQITRGIREAEARKQKTIHVVIDNPTAILPPGYAIR